MKRLAVRTYERAVKYGPGWWWAWQRLGATYRAKGDLEESVNVYRRAVRENPSEEWASTGLRISEAMLSNPERKPGSSPFASGTDSDYVP